MFLSKLDDQYRPAYGRHVKTQTRKSVFFGTTNDHEYLRDPTGNRRFWPVDAMVQQPTKTVFGDLDDELDQLWAEAVMRWRLGEPVYLSKDLEQEADRRRDDHFEHDPRAGMIAEFLDRSVPEDWNDRSIDARRIFWRSTFPSDEQTALVARTKVCAAEVWAECLHVKDEDAVGRMRKSDAREINSVLKRLPGWEECRETFGPYGASRGFKRR